MESSVAYAENALNITIVQQKIIRNEEICHCIIEGKEVEANGTKSNKPRFIVWIKSKANQNQSAILVVKKKKHQNVWIIQEVFSLLDLKINRKSSTLYDFVYNAKVVCSFETSDTDNISALLRATTQSPNSKRPDTYQWLEFYLNNRVAEDDEGLPSSEAYERGTLNLSNSSGSLEDLPMEDLKESWIGAQLKQREAEFTDTKTISIFCGTWNVNGKKPTESLVPWLVNGLLTQPPDIYAIGFQELDLSAENFLLGSSAMERTWEETITQTLRQVGKYNLVELKRLVGILLLVYVKDEHMSSLRSVQTGDAATGIMGMMGNKGGVAIRFHFRDSKICFVNSHLNAHHDNVQRRNQDYNDIVQYTLFQNSRGQRVISLFDHDYLFWLGDLNYRIMLPDAEVRQKCKEEDWSPLVEADQLRQQIKSGAAFEGFLEGPLKFAPTYKYDVGTNDYDTSEKRRAPAWCDRVLWRGEGATLQAYGGRQEMLSSDHKPVSALFEVKVKRTIADAKAKVYQDIVRHLDKLENESRPSATVDKNQVDFGEVKFGAPCMKTITLENTGKVAAKFQFIPKFEEKRYCKPWMTIHPPFGILIPGEKITIKLTVHIDHTTALDFNLGKEKLEDILILHLNGGLDYFISLTGKYLVSCFGSLLVNLVRYPGPVRTTKSVPIDYPDSLNVPKELWRIVDYLYRKGIDEENLFLQSGVPSEMQIIRECLDTGDSFEKYTFDVHSMAETMIVFLDSLGESVIPCAMYNYVLECQTLNQCQQLVLYMNRVHYNVFYYLISFLKEVLLHCNNNKLSIDKIAVLFSSVLIRPSRTDPIPRSQHPSDMLVRKKAAFMEFFLKPSQNSST